MPITVITGASRGIGSYLSKHYEGLGHTVIKISRSDGVDIGVDVEKIRAKLSWTPVIDNLINCAGIASMNHISLMTDRKICEIVRTNVVGTINMCRAVTRRMRQGSRIVLFSSVAVPLDLSGEAVYAASKGAVESLTRTLAKEYAPTGITVNCIGPNPIQTDLLKGLKAEVIDSLIQKQVIKRMGMMEDISNITDFYLQNSSNFVTGQTLYLGGC